MNYDPETRTFFAIPIRGGKNFAKALAEKPTKQYNGDVRIMRRHTYTGQSAPDFGVVYAGVDIAGFETYRYL